jgi:hypothetical protein
LPRLTEGWEKRFLDLTTEGREYESGPIPLAAAYLIADRRDDERALRIEPIAGADAVVSLVANTYTHSSLELRARTDELATLARVAATIPVVRIAPRRDPAAIWDLCRAIVADVKARLG